MATEKRMFHCPRCRHTEEETVPNRLRCPKCGASIPRPERSYFVGAPRRFTAWPAL